MSNIIGDVVSGLTGPANAALLADCVPTDKRTGLAVNPARDYLIMGYASKIPEIIIPIVLGLAFLCFDNAAAAYRAFFLVSGGIHLCSSFMFLKVGKELRKAKAQQARWQAGEGEEGGGGGGGGRGGAGGEGQGQCGEAQGADWSAAVRCPSF